MLRYEKEMITIFHAFEKDLLIMIVLCAQRSQDPGVLACIHNQSLQMADPPFER
jgi:hypothetical protein